MEKIYNQCLNVSEKNFKYLNLSKQRAKGKVPEMEVAKAYSKLLKDSLNQNSKLIDIGCLGGHFLFSFRKRLNKKFYYFGLDPFSHPIKAAKKIWKNDPNSDFKVGWAQKIPCKNKSFDFLICSNVITHIPSIIKPIKEFIRVTKKKIILRTPIHDKSYRIQMVHNKKWWKYSNIEPINEFDKKGNPRSFEYYDVHSKDYMSSVIKSINKKSKIKFVKDTFFQKKNINNKKERKNIPTKVINGMQITDLLIVPNYFVIIEL